MKQGGNYHIDVSHPKLIDRDDPCKLTITRAYSSLQGAVDYMDKHMRDYTSVLQDNTLFKSGGVHAVFGSHISAHIKDFLG